MEALQTLRTPDDVLRFAHVLLFAASVPLLVRMKVSRLRTALEPPRPRAPPSAAAMLKLINLVEAARRFGWPLVRTGCLTRGITLYYFLRRAGVDVSLRFGAGYPDGQFAGHCWLVLEGEPFLEEHDPRECFAEVYSFPEGRAAGIA